MCISCECSKQLIRYNYIIYEKRVYYIICFFFKQKTAYDIGVTGVQTCALPILDPRPAIAATLVDADRLEAIIDELLTLARAGQAGQARRIDLEALLGELSPAWAARLALTGRDLEVWIDPDVPDPHASAAAVRQVLAVLVDNATAHGQGTVTVTVREASGAVAVDVSDEGPGVQEPPGVLFAQRADRHDGHGIGLGLARRLAEAEQGRLDLTRAAPPVFTLLLPPTAIAARGAEVTAAAASVGR